MQLSQNALQNPQKLGQKSGRKSGNPNVVPDQLSDLSPSDLKHSDLEFRALMPQAPKRRAKLLPAQPFKQSWVRTTVFTGAAASMVLPLIHKSVTTSYQDKPTETTVPPTAAFPTRGQSATEAIGKGKAVLPQTSDRVQANFSAAATPQPSVETSKASEQPANQAARPSLITKDKDGNWTLSQALPQQTGTGQASDYQAKEAQRAQVAVAQLAKAAAGTNGDGLSQQVCQGGSCGGLAYIDSQLPKARQQVKSIQSQIQQFEATRAQQDMGAYRQVLAARMAEIDQQKNQLTISTAQTRQQIDGIKTRLAAVDPDGLGVAIVDRALFQDALYQAAWTKLVGSENSLLEEFSSANIDATALNEIYGDYQFQQQALQRAAADALGSYLATTNNSLPSFIQQSPDALSLLQDLTTSAYEYQVQLLRLGTIDQITQKLLVRQRQLSSDMGQYEQLQRQQVIAQQQVSQYEQAREKILTQQEAEQEEVIADGAIASKATSGAALARARELAPQMPEGSAAQIVIFAVLAAGAIAAISARRTAKQTVLPNWVLEGADSPLMLQGVSTHRAARAAISPALALSELAGSAPASTQTFPHHAVLPSLDHFFAGITSNEPAEGFEQRMLAELQAITGQAAHVVNEVPAASYSAEDSLTIEIMTRDLDHMFQKAALNGNLDGSSDESPSGNLEGSLLNEINERAKASTKLPLKEVDAFADHAVRWILKDLGLAQSATR